MDKTQKESITENSYIVYAPYLNGKNTLFGGKLAEWADTVASITARRHCSGEVTTALIDNMRYIAPIPVNSTLVLQGRVTYAGNTSLEVCVDGFIEEFDGSRSLVMSCAMLFVGVDKAGRPVKVPGLLLDEAEAARDGLPAQRRLQARAQRRREGF